LTEDNYRMLYVPERFAHGYQALRDNTNTSYRVGEFYAPGCEGGLLHEDPRLALPWPLPVTVISDKDRLWKRFDEQKEEIRQRMSLQPAGIEK
jgi:dTDP-4-dehydrorhamnose 3,5-epimerase